METEKSSSKDRPSEVWVYQPNSHDNDEIRDEYSKNPSPPPPPQEIQVTLQGQDGTMMPYLNLKATEQSLQLQSIDVNTQLRHTVVDVPYSNIRYVTTYCAALCNDPKGADRFVIMVSTRRPAGPESEVEVFNMYIKPDTAEKALAILNFLYYHIFCYLMRVTNSEDPTVLQQYVRPLVGTKLEVKVHWRILKKSWSEERIIVLDQECIALYTKPFQEQPSDVLFFWEEQSRDSAAKVSHIKSANCMFLQSANTYLVISCEQNETVVDSMKKAFLETIKPVPRKVFEDASVLLQWLSGNYVRPQDPDIPEETQQFENQMELEQTEMDKLCRLEQELEASLSTPPESQERQLWNNSRPSLQQAMLNNALPQVNENAWDFDANNVDHLLKAFAYIEREMFSKVDYKAALATTLAMKRLFLESKVQRVRRLVEESAMDLLCKICLRGNVALKQASSPRPGVVPPGGAQEDAGDLLNQEDMDEAMAEEEDDEDL